jgi:hypothetical protein
MRISPDESFYSAWCSEPGLNAGGECVEVAYALDLVIRKFHAEMIFETRQEFQRLQAVDPEFLVKIVTRLKFSARKFKMSSRKIQNFVGCLFDCFHDSFYFTGKMSLLAIHAGFL